ncbi:unnamed protein product [Xylocopa violacea]|uniref:polyribonucleotide nucleotidyltransferase n=1 Tax=Xylocopa violacea TaxID=135666 RepID=A0ABP1PD01_XYLVO
MVLFRRNGLLNNRSFIFLRSMKNHNKNGNIFHIKFLSDDATENVCINLSNGSTLKITTGKYARFTSGSVIATLGDTSIMSTVVRKNVPSKESVVPLTVNYRQKAAAIGRIPTNSLRKEVGHSDHEILTSRIIDRSLRPLFKKGYSYETQIICNLLAIDGINDPDVLSINAASAALSISDIPWNGPVAAVRVGYIDEKHVINPSKRDLRQSKLNLVLSCTSKNLVVMLEGSADNILEPELKKALKMGIKECQIILKSLRELKDRVGKPKLIIDDNEEENKDVEKFVRKFAENELREIFNCHSHDKTSRSSAVNDVKDKMLEYVKERGPKFIKNAEEYFDIICKSIFRSLIFETKQRCDGRRIDELRNIQCQVDLFQPLHGSAFFQRGQTQVLSTVTLDSIESSLKLDTISMLTSGIREKNFFLHYEFPPYAVNETGKISHMDRREIGHGALAEKGLQAVVPQDYPFTIRLTSEVLESNGSSSMASICAGSLALMDAGVPISAPVAGVAMGLIYNYDNNEFCNKNYRILTDISGIEDHLGDMDFKIAVEIIQSATVAKNQIINIMNEVLSSPNSSAKENMPVLDTINVPVHQRGKFIGIGKSNLRKIFFETGVNIYTEGDTVFSIFAPNKNALNAAKSMIDEILQKDVEPTLTFGDIYTAKITEIRETGVMVRLYPTMVPTLLPNSQLDQRKIHHPSVLDLNVGDEIKVKYFGRDPVNGRIRLSRKVLQDPISSSQNLNITKETMGEYKGQVQEFTG